MADVVDTRLPRWGWRHGARAAAAAAGIALLVGALELVSRTIGGGRPAPAVAALALGAAGVAIGALLRADHAAGTALGALSAPALGLGLAALGARGGSSAWFLCLLCAGTAAGAAVTHASDRSRHAALGLAAAAGALGLAALAAVAWTAADVEAVAMVLVVAGVAALPRLSLRIAGLPTDPRGVRAQAVVSLTPRAHDLTTWLLAGTGLAAAALSVPLALQAGIYGRLLVAFAGLALLLRARSFTVLGEVLAPAVAGAACLVILVTGLAASIGASLQAALVVGLPAIVAALAAAAGPRPGSPALQLGARRAELVANLALLPLIAGQLGLYTLVHDLTAGIL